MPARGTTGVSPLHGKLDRGHVGFQKIDGTRRTFYLAQIAPPGDANEPLANLCFGDPRFCTNSCRSMLYPGHGTCLYGSDFLGLRERMGLVHAGLRLHRSWRAPIGELQRLLLQRDERMRSQPDTFTRAVSVPFPIHDRSRVARDSGESDYQPIIEGEIDMIFASWSQLSAGVLVIGNNQFLGARGRWTCR